jgi:hypothetical protein
VHTNTDHAFLQGTVQELEHETVKIRESCEANLQKSARAADERLEKYKRSHAEEMDHIHVKLKDVLQRKNDTVTRLQSSLESAEARIVAYEEQMRREKLRLLEQMQW